MAKRVINDVISLEYIAIDRLTPFQGNLKYLTKKNYNKLKKTILDLGFSEPISVWENEDKLYVLNGHQRLYTLQEMAKEKYSIPDIPICRIRAKSLKEAKKKILALTSQYGTLSEESLADYIMDSDLSLEALENFNFPEINLKKFTDSIIKNNDIDKEIKKLEDQIELNRELLIVVECQDENMQKEVFGILSENNIECKIIS